MGCISSKLAISDRDREKQNMVICSIVMDCPNHVVSLTSTTYGALKLDREVEQSEVVVVEEDQKQPPKSYVRSPLIPPFRKSVSKEEPEIINTWELMKDLNDESPVKKQEKSGDYSNLSIFTPVKKHAKQNLFTYFPKEMRHLGKENKDGFGVLLVPDANRVLKPLVSVENTRSIDSSNPTSAVRYKNTPTNLKMQITRRESVFSPVSRRKSLSPLFDPELVASYENELCQEKEQIKLMISATPKILKATDLLESYEKICPSGGENTVVLYTTTLRGIRKTFKDCNAVRSTVESHGIQVIERDISMDSGFREELRLLMGKKEVKVPVLFVKGRLIGGSDEVLKLEEEGKLELLFDGVPTVRSSCDGCGGVRFVMCMDCSGSCKILDEEQNKTVKCVECNENGLIHCPICS